jgi:hypothetical protein
MKLALARVAAFAILKLTEFALAFWPVLVAVKF